ncbi:MAG: PCC domain-containing protein [Candidatus Dormibacteria bacterium]
MQTIVTGKLERVVYAQLSPQEDVYRAIVELAAQERINNGLVLTITGGLEYIRLSMPGKGESNDMPPGIFESEGPAEATGQGYLGRTASTWISPRSQIAHHEGEAFMHVHMGVSIGGVAYVGHLIEGCKVRSLHPKSHFIVVLGEVKGVDLSFHNSGVVTENYPQGLPFYELAQED